MVSVLFFNWAMDAFTFWGETFLARHGNLTGLEWAIVVIPGRGVIVLWWIGFSSIHFLSHQSTFGFRNLANYINGIQLSVIRLYMRRLPRNSPFFLLRPCSIRSHLNVLLLFQLDNMIPIRLDDDFIFINIIFFFLFFNHWRVLVLLLTLETLLIRLTISVICLVRHLWFDPHESCQVHEANREFGRNLLVDLFLI